MKYTHQYALSSSISQICERNHSFDSGVVHIAYPDKNRNGSSISKEVFENCIETLYYIPIVCNYDRETDDMGGHDIEFVESGGGLKMINATTPIGVIPENANYWWETIDGKEYLCAEALLWKRQEEYDKLKKDGHVDLSMEIGINSYHMDDALMVIDSFEFLALCLLGSNVEPCYESAGLEVFSVDEYREQYLQMVAELKSEAQMVNTSDEVDIDETYNLTKGEDPMDKQIADLLAKYGLTAEELDFDIEGMTLEELEAKFAEQDAAGQEEPEAEEPVDGEVEQDPADESLEFSLTGEQLRDGLFEALSSVKYTDDWGYECIRYWYNDYDAERSEVYCNDTTDWKLYGFTYAVDGDSVSVDFDSKKRMKYAIVDFIDGSDDSMTSVFEEFANRKVAAEQVKFNQELDNANQKIGEMETELTELRAFQQETLDAERAEQEEEVFSAFPDLVGVEEFESLRENCSDMEIEAIEERCFALRGRNMQQNFSAKRTSVRIPVDRHEAGEDRYYGGLFEEFPPTNRY